MNDLSGARVLVTGAAGFIGSHLVDALLARGAESVTGVDNLVAGQMENLTHLASEKRFRFVWGDVQDAGLIDREVAHSDIVFHLAASKLVVSRDNPRVDLGTNIVGSFNIFEAAKRAHEAGRKIRVVYASTGSTLGSSEKPMREDHEKRPTTLYGISKGTAEDYGLFFQREFGVPVSILRYFHVYGPRQDYAGAAGVINIFLGRILTGEPPIIHGSGEQIRCFTFVLDDVAATIYLGLESRAIGEIFHVASTVRISIKDLAELLIKRYSKKAIRPVFDEPRPGEAMRPVPDTSKIEALGFHVQTPFEEGLDKTHAWVREDLIARGRLRP